ncbi:MAG: SDR family NAD(P)-dependent oxidoreductase [Planctomycetes bacterium]|nr:SDR family NAD(P)-dependent oxidoreductase [Planctomycetota bacterium]
MGRRRELKGLRAVVTGASQGIGRALALEGARRGMVIIAQARSRNLLDTLAGESEGLPGKVITEVGDVTCAADRERLVRRCQNEVGGLDILVNNAGIGATGHFADSGPERLRQIFEVNVFGLVETTRALLPLIVKGITPMVVNVGSIVGERGFPARSEYSSSKFAVHAFSDGLRAELSKDGVDVLMIAPGLTQTNFSQNMIEQSAKVQLDHMRGMTSEDVALATWNSAAKGRDEVFLTRQGRLLLLVNRFLPWLVDRIMRRKVKNLFKDEPKAAPQAVS